MQNWSNFISFADITALRFLPIWERLTVHTPMGERLKQTCRPYYSSEKEQWQRDIHEVQRMRSVVKDIEQFRLYVKGMVDIAPIVRNWMQGTIPQRMDWFHIKSFLQKGLRVLSLPNWEVFWDRFPKDAHDRWTKALEWLSPFHSTSAEATVGFQLEALFPSLFQSLQEEMQQLELEKHRKLTSRKQRVERELGFMIGQQSPFYITRKEHDKITALELHGAFEKVKETPFDVAFAWKIDEVDQTLQRRQETLEQRWQAVEQQAVHELANMMLPFREELLLWVDAFGKLDFTYAKARLAHSYNGTVPHWLEEERTITLQGGIHPWLAEQWEALGNTFAPIDLQVQRGQVAVIIGPNMGGKSVALKTLGLCTLMAQLGLPVPAQHFRFSPIDGIMFIGGDYEQPELGLSSFGGEMRQLSALFARSNEERLLILCDEVCRGTNPEEGEALALAIVEALGKTEWYSCFVSHYSKVLQTTNVRLYKIVGEDSEGDLKSNPHRLIPIENGTIPCMAIKIAERMGIPGDIIERARQVLKHSEKGEETDEQITS